jgi:hypothetical protein
MVKEFSSLGMGNKPLILIENNKKQARFKLQSLTKDAIVLK